MEKTAIIDARLEIYRATAQELELRGWKIARVHDALKPIYIPKCKLSIFILSIEEAPFLLQQTEEKCADAKVILLIPPKLILGQLRPIFNLSKLTIIPAQSVLDAVDLLEVLSRNRFAGPKVVTPFAQAVKWMTWRRDGLPDELVNVLTSRFGSMPQFLEAMDELKADSFKDADNLLVMAMSEVAMFVEEDYFLED